MAMLWVGVDENALAEVPLDPSSLEWGLNDVSASDAGRTHDANATMYKMLITQKRKLKLEWLNPEMAVASQILTLFNHEYLHVRYWDVMDNQLETRLFYVGDRSAPFRWYSLPNRADSSRLTKLAFDIIER